MTRCKVSDQCGGCEYIGRPYEYQLGLKQAHINKLMEGICPVDNIIPCDEPYYYRNKVHAAYKRLRGKVICGTYAKGSHRIIEHSKCYIENRKAQEIIETIRDIAEKHKMSVYDERTNRGLLRRVLVRVSEETGQIMVVLVTGSKYFTGKRAFISELLERHPEITTILSSVNERRDSMILGNKANADYGKGYIEDVILGHRFRLSAESFLQVNSRQTEKLYSTAIGMAQLRMEDRVLDCYCGIGTITLSMAPLCGEVTGVEINDRAVADAKVNARLNNVTNAVFIGMDATEFMKAAAGEGDHFDVVVMDPPRAGSTPEFIDSVAQLGPEKVVYISCDPETLARDLKLFIPLGYKPVRAVPVDMFPWTEDVETVVLLSKLNGVSGS